MVEVKEDLIGRIFGELTVVERGEDHITPSGKAFPKWVCQCACGNKKEIMGIVLKQERATTCGCRFNYIQPTFKDLTGCVFGRLTVIKRAEDYVFNGGKEPQWLCLCSCGKQTVVKGSSLRSGKTQSCGCYGHERAADAAKKACKKYNDYEVQEDYVIMYTTKGEPFFVDLEDFWKVKNICWHMTNKGYLLGVDNFGEKHLLHRMVTDCPEGMDVDHLKPNTRYDNRKSNLQIKTHRQNSINRDVTKANRSGVVGVGKAKGRWRARITVNYKEISLGYYDSFEEAVKARKEAEEKYFGQWSFDNCQKLWRENNA